MNIRSRLPCPLFFQQILFKKAFNHCNDIVNHILDNVKKFSYGYAVFFAVFHNKFLLKIFPPFGYNLIIALQLRQVKIKTAAGGSIPEQSSGRLRCSRKIASRFNGAAAHLYQRLTKHVSGKLSTLQQPQQTKAG